MPEDQANVPSLPENIDTETAELLVVEGQVHFHFFLEFPTLLAPHQRQRESFKLFIGKRRRVGLLCRAVDSIGGSRVDGQVQVGGFLIHHDFQKTANIHLNPLFSPCQVSQAAPPIAVPNRLGFMLRDWASPFVTTPRIAKSYSDMSIVCMPSF